MKALIFYYSSDATQTLSYHDDWLDAFIENDILYTDTFNLAEDISFPLLVNIIRYDLIVFLHSTNSNSDRINRRLKQALKWRRAKILFFVGNEYKNMPRKINLLKELDVEYIASQLPQDTADWLYADCRKSRVISVPHALNEKVFIPEINFPERSLDIGVRAYEYPWYLGDRDRVDQIRFITESADFSHLKTDISLNPENRFNRREWAEFLNSCRATISTEAGVSYLERDDTTRLRVNQYVEDNPAADFDDVYDHFFSNYRNPVSGKCISSRHFDSVGTKTIQIMFPGRFNDILIADKHYIALERDFSNFREVLEKLENIDFCRKMVDLSYEYVRAEHTHKHRIESLLCEIII